MSEWREGVFRSRPGAASSIIIIPIPIIIIINTVFSFLAGFIIVSLATRGGGALRVALPLPGAHPTAADVLVVLGFTAEAPAAAQERRDTVRAPVSSACMQAVALGVSLLLLLLRRS